MIIFALWLFSSGRPALILKKKSGSARKGKYFRNTFRIIPFRSKEKAITACHCQPPEKRKLLETL
jgi:hypothetical protein